MREPGWLKWFGNAPLANLVFALVVVWGAVSYALMPRARDPEINFNWVNVWTVFPGASAEMVAREVTEPLEEALRSVADIRFVVSTSREGISSILVRFERLDPPSFDKRLADLRREVLNRASDFPEPIKMPRVQEITTSNGFPTAMVTLYGPVGGEVLRRFGEIVRRELEELEGVDRALLFGQQEPELAVVFDAVTLAGWGVSPVSVADQVRGWFQELAAGRVTTGEGEWLVEVRGKENEAEALAALPVRVGGREGEMFQPLGSLTEVSWSAERPRHSVRFAGEPALLFSLTKETDADTLRLIERVQAFVEERNKSLERVGLRLALVDDPTHETRTAVWVMERNAIAGFVLVLTIVGFFLGGKLAVLVALGMVFALAGTMGVVAAAGSTLNLTVLLGVVIALGMLVDDAVVVVESVHERLVRGTTIEKAVVEGLREVGWPVTSAVLTTMAAFLPLMVLPGVLGDFLRVVPLVVTVALGLSLLEAFWLLPAHILGWREAFTAGKEQWQRWRACVQRRLRNSYGRALVGALRHPGKTWLVLGGILGGAAGVVMGGWVQVQFFAFESERLFYVHVDLPVGVPLGESLTVADRLRARITKTLPPEEVRAVVAMAGVKFTETEPLYGDHLAQVVVSLHPRQEGGRTTEEVVNSLRPIVMETVAPWPTSFLVVKRGPPAERAIRVRVQGEEDEAREAAAAWVRERLATFPGVFDVQDDRVGGRPTVQLRWREMALAAAGVDPLTANRLAVLLADGEYVGESRRFGERVRVVVRGRQDGLQTVEDWLRLPVVGGKGEVTTLGTLAEVEVRTSVGAIRRFQFVRTTTVEAEVAREVTTPQAVQERLQREWRTVAASFPGVQLSFSGELDDVRESLEALQRVLAVGVGLIYVILAAQFRSYAQPLVVLLTVPLAFAGAIFGLALQGLPLSLYAMYGVVALSGIAVNSAIVLVAAVNDRQSAGMGRLHAVVYGARRRLVPIVITSTTTIGGLWSLATGFLGHSLLWGPVASAIVWGLGFSTALTLFVVPMVLLLLGRERG
ncbi:MAG: efflux RND transporter permease subunit [Hydrogenophilus sp.]|nr:efflux RND transporter permease subunit [Hydrogenophilus sp.]